MWLSISTIEAHRWLNLSDIASLGSRGTIYQSIVKKLSMLQPLELQLEDESNRHAGHAG